MKKFITTPLTLLVTGIIGVILSEWLLPYDPNGFLRTTWSYCAIPFISLATSCLGITLVHFPIHMKGYTLSKKTV